MTAHCANCEALRAQVINLERQMGGSFPKGAMGAVAERFGLSPQQTRLLLTIYYRDDWTPSREIERHLDMNDPIIKTNIYRLRQRIGRAMIESYWGLGYRLTPTGRTQIGEVLG